MVFHINYVLGGCRCVCIGILSVIEKMATTEEPLLVKQKKKNTYAETPTE